MPVLVFSLVLTISDGITVVRILCLLVHFALVIYYVGLISYMAFRIKTTDEPENELVFLVREFNYVEVKDRQEEEKKEHYDE